MQQLLDINNSQEIKRSLVPSTQVRRNWKDIAARVIKTGKSVVVTKGGKPLVQVGPIGVTSVKKNQISRGIPKEILKYAGSWKGTYLDSDEFWDEILTKDSKPVEETTI